MGIHGHTTILTGAANIVDAQYVIVAMVGAVLPGDFTISDRKMAGMTSSGMICGADEIGISGVVATGIMILEDTWPIDILQDMVGKSFFDLCVPTPGLHGSTYSFPLGGYTLEIDNKFITNRPDLFSVHGNAREFGAVYDIPFSPYTSTYDMQNILSNAKTRNTKIDTKNVLSYHLLEMHDIQVGYSPLGIDTMLHYAGIGSKMDIVDITNAISVELGQPMHVYDADRIDGDIVVRMAVDGEKLLALNNIEYTLTSDDIVIADQVRVLGIAGVIGGMYSAVGTETKNIVWESGCFDPTTIRLTAQRHGIRTDASTRYEKSLDPLSAYMALPRILEYMDFLGKHTPVVAASTYTDSTRVRDIVIEISPTYISTRAGVHIPTDRIVYILQKLGFGILENPLEKVGRGMDVSIAGTLSHDNILSISVPSWRATKDVSIPEDICEEVIRIYGYENIPMKSLDSEFSIGTKNHEKTLEYTTIDYLSSI
jgi:phenylalanyl-tRNA synthetase beta chain